MAIAVAERIDARDGLAERKEHCFEIVVNRDVDTGSDASGLCSLSCQWRCFSRGERGDPIIVVAADDLADRSAEDRHWNDRAEVRNSGSWVEYVLLTALADRLWGI